MGVEKVLSIEEVTTDSLATSDTQKYSFEQRVTAHELIEKYAAKVKNAQTTYLNSVADAVEMLTGHLRKCLEKNKVLGINAKHLEKQVQDNVEDATVPEDGVTSLKFPMHGCPITTFQLKRHLQKIHNLEGKKNSPILWLLQICLSIAYFFC